MATEQEKQAAYKAWRDARAARDALYDYLRDDNKVIEANEEIERLWHEWRMLEPGEHQRNCRISRNNGLSEPVPSYFG